MQRRYVNNNLFVLLMPTSSLPEKHKLIIKIIITKNCYNMRFISNMYAIEIIWVHMYMYTITLTASISGGLCMKNYTRRKIT